jgi:hypothetical protein
LTRDIVLLMGKELLDIGEGPEMYEQDSGALNVKKEGQYKFWAHLYKLAGAKGKIIDPETAARNFRNATKNQR